ncbi:GNAT family N-acetyltransferase [Glycomyces terrestris]|uniref:GNAT family N-acetyltransferase n=1 Tax=Glycomyces terrestris TaxID=2493553 RepID=UPI0018D557F8|nr:GNAT family N-acetyltransferase [Glycomyces terrestris]
MRCRVLAFLHTAYFDDVQTAKPAVPPPGLELVAADPSGEIRGILDIAIEGETATIDTIAVHPDHRSRGIGRALLQEATVHLFELRVGALEAWTRDDPATLRWYRSNGFAETNHYLHVYADYYSDPAEPDRAIAERRAGLRPIKAFLHATLDEEAAIRERFARVHVCRRFTQDLRG